MNMFSNFRGDLPCGLYRQNGSTDTVIYQYTRHILDTNSIICRLKQRDNQQVSRKFTLHIQIVKYDLFLTEILM